LEHLLFAGYLIVFAWLVTRTPFFTASGLSSFQLVTIFLLKVMAGIFYGWVGVYYGNMAQMVDTWSFHYDSLAEARLFRSDPVHYLSGFFSDTYGDGFGGFLGREKSWWDNLDLNFILKLFGLFNVASFGHYYINVIFYSFLTFFGPIAFYRVMRHVFPHKRLTLLLVVFFIPSFLYWTSGLHKEGLIFNGLALVVFVVYFGLKEKRWGLSRLLLLSVAFLLAFALRSYLALLLVPAVLTWGLAEKIKVRPLVVFTVFYTLFGAFFFLGPRLSASLAFPQAVVGKQRQFSGLSGNSEVPIRKLEPTAGSFVLNAPQAISLSLMRPYVTDIRHLLSMAAALEITVLFLLLLLWMLFNFRKQPRPDPFLLFCFFFSVSVLLIIGYTVNFLGAIVRYRSIVLPLLFVPVLAQLPWSKWLNQFTSIKKN
jgi:hypothetical protein